MSEENSLRTKENIQQIITHFEKNTASKISKLEMKQIQLNNPATAFWFGFGKYGLSIIVISLLLFSGWLSNRMEEKEAKDIEQISFLLEKSPAEERKLNDTITTRLITLFPAKNLSNALAGKNYVYRQDCNCIEIPLLFKKTNPTN